MAGTEQCGHCANNIPAPSLEQSRAFGITVFVLLHLPEVTARASIAHTYSAASQGANKSISACTMLWVPWENLCVLQPLQPLVAM